MKTYLPRINSKKADMSVIVFVFLVLTLCIYTLSVIASNKTKVVENLVGYDSPENMLLEKKDFEYRLTKLGEDCFIKSLEGPKVQRQDIDNWVEERSGEKLQNNISACIKEKATEYVKSLDDKENKNLKEFYNFLKDRNIGVTHLNDNIEIYLEEYNISYEENKYPVKMGTTISLGKIGFFNPEKVQEIFQYKDKETAEKYSKGIFDIEIEKIDDDKGYIFTLTTKRKFLIEDEFKNIVLEFYIDSEEY